MNKPRHSVPLDVHLILKKENDILCIRRCKTGFADGQYALVAGCQEANETITSAIIREAKEEVGIDLLPEWIKMSCVMHLKSDIPGERVCFFLWLINGLEILLIANLINVMIFAFFP